jgi:hypothetical protein
MAEIVSIQIPFASLVEAIASTNLEDKHKLQEILEDQIFEAEEEMENDLWYSSNPDPMKSLSSPFCETPNAQSVAMN